jgi:histidine triad (HIT) family protein
MVLAFKDIQPQRPVHVLVIPKKHITSLADATPEDTNTKADAGGGQPDCCRSRQHRGFRSIINTGRVGGQEVMHVHLCTSWRWAGPVGPMLKR